MLRQRDKEAADWQAERQLLITRIQHPQVLPLPEPTQVSDEELAKWRAMHEDDIDLVGTVQAGEAEDG